MQSEMQPDESPVHYLELIAYGHHAPEGHDRTMVEVLITSRGFHERLETVRQSLGIKSARNELVQKYLTSHRFTYTGLPVLLGLLANKHLLSKVKEAAAVMVYELDLPERWSEPLQLAILSDYITLPPNGAFELEIHGVHTDISQDASGRIKEKLVPIDGEIPEITIRLNEATSMRQLLDFIGHNHEAHQVLNALMTDTRTKVQQDADVIFWGVEVWEAKRQGVLGPSATFGSIRKYLEDKYADADTVVVPLVSELAMHYRRYLVLLPKSLH